jgi:hypothetical protein
MFSAASSTSTSALPETPSHRPYRRWTHRFPIEYLRPVLTQWRPDPRTAIDAREPRDLGDDGTRPTIWTLQARVNAPPQNKPKDHSEHLFDTIHE